MLTALLVLLFGCTSPYEELEANADNGLIFLSHQFRGAETSPVSAGPPAFPQDPEWGADYGTNAATVTTNACGGTQLGTAAVAAGDVGVLRPIGTGPWTASELVSPGPPGTALVMQLFIEDTAEIRNEVGARPTPLAFDATTDDNAAFFFYDTTISETWHFASNAGGQGYVVTDTSVGLAAQKSAQVFGIEYTYNAPYHVLATIDGIQVAEHDVTGGAAYSAPYVGVKNVGMNPQTKSLVVVNVALSRKE